MTVDAQYGVIVVGKCHDKIVFVIYQILLTMNGSSCRIPSSLFLVPPEN